MKHTKENNMDKKERARLLAEIMAADAKDGLYDRIPKPFTVSKVRDITDQLEMGEISYSRMVEMLNEIAMEYGYLRYGEGYDEGLYDRFNK